MAEYNAQFKFKTVLAVKKSRNKTAACERRGVSYTSYRKWLSLTEGKSKEAALRALANGDRRPKHSPAMTAKETAQRVIELRAAGLGRDHIAAKMRREGYAIGKSAVEGVLRRLGVWEKRVRPKRKKWKVYTPLLRYPGQKCQMDLKYVPFPVDGKRRYQFTITDLYTRMTFRAIYAEKAPHCAADFFRRAIAYFPFRIQTLQTDNGTEFTYRMIQHQNTHPLEEVCEEFKIKHVFIPVATPRYNGVVENVHGRDQQEVYDRIEKSMTERELKQKIRERNQFWNNERLHSAIGYATPKERLKAHIARHGKPKSKFQYVSR